MTDRSKWVRTFLTPDITKLEKEYSVEQFEAIVREGSCFSFNAQDYGTLKGLNLPKIFDVPDLTLFGCVFKYDKSTSYWIREDEESIREDIRANGRRTIEKRMELTLKQKIHHLVSRPNKFMGTSLSDEEVLAEILKPFDD